MLISFTQKSTSIYSPKENIEDRLTFWRRYLGVLSNLQLIQPFCCLSSFLSSSSLIFLPLFSSFPCKPLFLYLLHFSSHSSFDPASLTYGQGSGGGIGMGWSRWTMKLYCFFFPCNKYCTITIISRFLMICVCVFYSLVTSNFFLSGMARGELPTLC